VMSPKSLLRHPRAVSSLDELAAGAFHPVLDDALVAANGTGAVRRVLLASGKVVYDLLAAREKAGRDDVAVVRLEQYYPFPSRELGQVLGRYPAGAEIAWVQEEPRNMGAWRFIREQFLEGQVDGVAASRTLRYIGRRELASPAPGSHHAFESEQEALVAEALRVPASSRAAV
jgi:2-oxoglutarate dehydrogenase complex dehydrogenase (E1) component-like enzyme